MRQLGLFLVALIMSVSSVASISLAATESSKQVEGESQVDQMIGQYNLYPPLEKLGRGLSNALAGWMEIPLGVNDRYNSQDTAGSIVNGLLIGLVKGVARTGVGLYETATFFLPYPEDFAPILPTLAYFNKEDRTEALPLE
jgi:putative exosortase-associated protein (TIGR04073 family)